MSAIIPLIMIIYGEFLVYELIAKKRIGGYRLTRRDQPVLFYFFLVIVICVMATGTWVIFKDPSRSDYFRLRVSQNETLTPSPPATA